MNAADRDQLVRDLTQLSERVQVELQRAVGDELVELHGVERNVRQALSDLLTDPKDPIRQTMDEVRQREFDC